jgi:uncharacterized protein (TIRG00374 family)
VSRAHEEGSGAGRRRLRRIVTVLIGAVVVEYLVFPQLAGARKALQLLGRVEPLWLVAGAVLEVAAIVCYAELTRTLLPAAGRPSRPTLVRITLSTLGMSHVVPGGAAVGSSMGYRLLTSHGVRGADAGFALAAESLGSAVVLNVLLWFGLLVSIPIRGFNPLYAAAAVLGAVLLTAVGGAVVLLTKGEDRLAATVSRWADRVPFLEGEGVARALRRVAERLRALGADPRLLVKGATWATLNWLLDAASLWLFLAAFGYRVGLDGLVISYGLANVFAAIPLTPGGLGVIETVLTATLVGFGTPRGIALLGVVSWRILNFWLPIPLGAVSYLTLRVGAAEDEAGARAASELLRVTEEAGQAAPRAGQWAREYGVRLPPVPTPRRRRGERGEG